MLDLHSESFTGAESRITHDALWGQQEAPGIWWRYESRCVLGAVPSLDWVEVAPWPYRVVRETEASVWLNTFEVSGPRRVQKDWRRKFAYPTKAEAWTAWKRRFSYRKAFHAEEGRRIAALEKLLGAEG